MESWLCWLSWLPHCHIQPQPPSHDCICLTDLLYSYATRVKWTICFDLLHYQGLTTWIIRCFINLSYIMQIVHLGRALYYSKFPFNHHQGGKSDRSQWCNQHNFALALALEVHFIPRYTLICCMSMVRTMDHTCNTQLSDPISCKWRMWEEFQILPSSQIII